MKKQSFARRASCDDRDGKCDKTFWLLHCTEPNKSNRRAGWSFAWRGVGVKGVKGSTWGVLLITAAQMVQQMRWIKSQGYDRKREKWQQSTSLTAYIRSSWLGNFQRKRLNIYCSTAGGTRSLHLRLVSKKNGSGAVSEILIPLEKHSAEGRKAWSSIWCDILRGRTAGSQTLQPRTGRGSEDGRNGGELNYWEEDSTDLMSLQLQERYIWIASILCFASYYYYSLSQYSFCLPACDKCRSNKREMTFYTGIKNATLTSLALLLFRFVLIRDIWRRF